MFFYTLEERGPFHEVCEVEVEVIVFGEGVEIAEVELQEVTGSDSADGRHLFANSAWAAGDISGPFQPRRPKNDLCEKRAPRKSGDPTAHAWQAGRGRI
jgi:hypothetical protein